jgi:amino acid permease
MNLKYISVFIALAGAIGFVINFFTHGFWFAGNTAELQQYQWRCLMADMLMVVNTILIAIFVILYNIADHLKERH